MKTTVWSRRPAARASCRSARNCSTISPIPRLRSNPVFVVAQNRNPSRIPPGRRCNRPLGRCGNQASSLIRRSVRRKDARGAWSCRPPKRSGLRPMQPCGRYALSNREPTRAESAGRSAGLWHPLHSTSAARARHGMASNPAPQAAAPAMRGYAPKGPRRRATQHLGEMPSRQPGVRPKSPAAGKENEGDVDPLRPGLPGMARSRENTVHPSRVSLPRGWRGRNRGPGEPCCRPFLLAHGWGPVDARAR